MYDLEIYNELGMTINRIGEVTTFDRDMINVKYPQNISFPFSADGGIFYVPFWLTNFNLFDANHTEIDIKDGVFSIKTHGTTANIDIIKGYF